MPGVANLLTDFVVLFRREGAAANAGRVRFHNPDDVFNELGGNARSSADAHARGVAAGNERERAVVNIQQSALRPFKENVFIGVNRVEQKRRRVRYHRLELFSVNCVLFERFCIRNLLFSAVRVHAVKILIFDLRNFFQPFRERRQIQVAQTKRHRPPHFIAIALTDSAHGRSNRLVSAQRVHNPVFQKMPRHNHVQTVGQRQIVSVDLNAARRQPFDFFQKPRRVKHDAVGNDAFNVVMKNTAGNKRQLKRLTAKFYGMPGVRAALIPDADFVLLR